MKLIAGELYKYPQSVQAYISPPVAAVFLIGVFYKRVNAKGAIVSLIAGFILGMGRLGLELNKDALGHGLLYRYADMNFMHMAIFLFVICSGVLVIVSLLTRPEPEAKLAGLTFATAEAVPTGQRAPVRTSTQIGHSLIVVALVAAV